MVPVKRIEETNPNVMCVSRHSTPKCFRQIGHPDNRDHIYMEDYVKSYLEHVSEACVEEGCVLAIYGSFFYSGGCREWYLDGAAALSVGMNDMMPDSGEIITSEIESVRAKHFPEWEFLGWLFALPQFLSGETVLYEEMTRAWFGQRELIFVSFLMYEKELECRLYNGQYLENLKGFYIYYDRNPQMQEYMVEHQWAVQSEVRPEMPVDRTAEAINHKFRRSIETNPSQESLQNRSSERLHKKSQDRTQDQSQNPSQDQSHEQFQMGDERMLAKTNSKRNAVRAKGKEIFEPVRHWSVLTLVTVIMSVTFLVLLGIFIYTQYNNMDQVAAAVKSLTESIISK